MKNNLFIALAFFVLLGVFTAFIIALSLLHPNCPECGGQYTEVTHYFDMDNRNDIRMIAEECAECGYRNQILEFEFVEDGN